MVAQSPRCSPAETPQASSRGTVTMAAAVLATALLAMVAWVVAMRQMSGMDMGPRARLGSLSFFLAVWVPMMSAMMLPGVVPAVWRHARTVTQLPAVLVFLVLYLAVWTLVGMAVYALYRPHGYVAAGAATVAAGVYELMPVKVHFRRRCHEAARSGLQFGLYCVGSSLGLMLMFVALGIMSVTWMAVVAVLIAAEKVLPARVAVNVPVGVAIVGLGALVLAAPSVVPGFVASM